MTNSYNIGDLVTLSTEFKAGSSDADPTTVAFVYQDPAGIETTLVYNVDAGIFKDATGKYHVDLIPNMSGLWQYTWEGTGALDASVTGQIFVRRGIIPVADMFCDVSDVAAYLRQDIDPADPIAIRGIRAATQAIRKYTDQHITQVVNDVVALDGTGDDTMLLPDAPVSDVSEVIVDIDLDNPRVLIPPSDSSAEYDFTEETGLLVRRRGLFVEWTSQFTGIYGVWPSRRKSVQVTYTHGYAECPDDVALIAAAVAARGWAQDGATQETTGTYTAMYAGQPATLTEAEKRVLDRYRTRRQ